MRSSCARRYGAVRLELGALPPAHTNGDLYVFLREANVLMVSDTLTVKRYPVMDYSTGGWIGGVIDANTALLALADDNTRIVPGLGPMHTSRLAESNWRYRPGSWLRYYSHARPHHALEVISPETRSPRAE